MYIQWFVKGIAGQRDSDTGSALTWSIAQRMLSEGHGILSNWWRNKPSGSISPPEVEAILTEQNLDLHVHEYATYGAQTPFISVASGCVERNTLVSQNFIYSAVTTALEFATDSWAHPGALFIGWLPVALNPAIPLSGVAEAIRDLNVYHRWSPFQLEGEITAKIHIPSNQIKAVQWWDGSVKTHEPIDCFRNDRFIEPKPITNERDYF